ncbi:MAG: bifunctional folylpolyglutamate synthase/dihydrofolate synthase [Myxococcales bacterium]
MTPDGALDWLESLRPLHVDLGLTRIARLLERLGHPERSYRCLHVAGTNGKGSTCAMAAEALRAAGLRTGLYTSPHLVRFEERVGVDGAPIGAEDLARAADAVRAAAAADIPLTYFEAGTALALQHFRGRVDVAVLETGLGGRLDATTAVSPAACAITALGLDHTELLGPTIADIAREKAGILKPGVPCAAATPPPEALPVLESRAREVGCELWLAGRDFALEGSRYRGRNWSLDGVEVGLLGPHQKQNAGVALALLELASRSLRVPPEAARRGVREARWPGRLEAFERGGVTVVLDGAHNPQGAQALAAALPALWPGRPMRLVFGVLEGKEAAPMIAALFPLARSVRLAAPLTQRARAPETLLPLARRHCHDVSLSGSVPEALRTSLASAEPSDLVVVCGSLYVVGEARPLLLPA